MKSLLIATALVALTIHTAWCQNSDAPYGVPYKKSSSDNESATYVTTAEGSILGPAADEIAKAEKGTSIAARFAYLTDIRIANALSEAANRGVTVMVLLAAKPPIKSYTAPAYLARNGVSVFLDNTLGAETSTENYIIMNQAATCLLLSVPPDPKKETLPASLMVLRNAVSTRNALLTAFGKALEDKLHIVPYTPRATETQPPTETSK